jgi:thiol-disulfide isomerase/thioredoxin
VQRVFLALLMLATLGATGAADAPLELQSLDGAPLALGPPQGDAVFVVHFWASWCPSCLAELAALDEAALACAGTPVRIVAVNAGEDAETVTAFLARQPLHLFVLLDPKARMFRRLAGHEMPVNAIWSAAERHIEPGPRDLAAWRARLAELGCRTESHSN